ncbi:endonuclease-reverse transcriptase [Plakobranchus ocellatus]|uniref:Endonuclease-reverse transcriptase n=1 Tax=Plakobranchus ocellatus TaxID=259542 RepID=A0AAV3YB16_9GAST|nr:endonuclease-reverse transcriptase [Plakobranchus ocellatus]
MPGIKVGGKKIDNIRYADDTGFIVKNLTDLQKLVETTNIESKRKALNLTKRKGQVMVISRKAAKNCNIIVGIAKLKRKDTFKYLGVVITQNSKNAVEISPRIAQAKETKN